MTEQQPTTRGPSGFQIGAFVALVLLVVSGAGYRMASARLAADTSAVPLPRGTLEKIPRTIGDWIGRDLTLDEELVRATDTDDHVSRTYAARTGFGLVSLFVGYGVRLRDLVPHRPEVCYSGAGWTLDSTEAAEIETADAGSLGCQIHHFHRGGLGTQNMTVLNYYIVDGRNCADVSLLRSRTWRLDIDTNYVAQIQIACSGSSARDRCMEAVTAFARVSAPEIQKCLVEGVERARLNETESSQGGD